MSPPARNSKTRYANHSAGILDAMLNKVFVRMGKDYVGRRREGLLY